MILIVGLGNPDKEYERTRHNVGAYLVEKLKSKKEKGVVWTKTKTFMNNSGKAIQALMKYYKAKPENLFVIHDDIDLPLGKIKFSRNRGSGGHKGIESIIQELKTKDFNRIRIGVCPEKGKPKTLEKFVLQNFTKEENEILKQVFQITASEITKITNQKAEVK
ncbi:MAG: aminoacyl-tRNA hydrolase [Candidatus Nealsonbacteria bacterium]